MNRGLVGAAVCSMLILAACGRVAPTATSDARATIHPASSLSVTQLLPGADLAAAHLTDVGTLVTPLKLDATDQGRTLTLIGAYADAARTVLFFHGAGRDQLEFLEVSDDHGLINAGGSSNSISTSGDFYYALDEGARPGSDGVARLSIKVTGIHTWPFGNGSQIQQGLWLWTVSLKPHGATALTALKSFQVGRWKVNVETIEVTPSVVHVQAVVNGASPAEISGSPTSHGFVSLFDAGGNLINPVAGDARITVPKQQLNPSNYRNSRINYEWPRPHDATTMELRFQGGGGSYKLPIMIPALQL